MEAKPRYGRALPGRWKKALARAAGHPRRDRDGRKTSRRFFRERLLGRWRAGEVNIMFFFYLPIRERQIKDIMLNFD